MAFINNLVILLTITLMLCIEGTHEYRAIPSKEEYKEMEMQLKAINKPAILSFKTEDGDIFDCIEIHKQLAFDHPILKNHSVQLKPTSEPEWDKGNNISERHDPFQLLEKGISCPDGTVIIKRITLEYLMQAKRLKSMGFDGPRPFLTERNETNSDGQFYIAVAEYSENRPGSLTGIKGIINLWEPKVSKDQFSNAHIQVGGGSRETFSTIAVGWMVYPSMYKSDSARLYASWIRGNTGCYDLTCPGFVQVSKTLPLSRTIQPASVYNGAQYGLRLSLFQDRTKGDWWLAYRNENIGYWPASLFSSSGLKNGLEYGTWGGQVYSSERRLLPTMGSSHWPNEGFRRSAFVNDMKIIDGSGKVLDPNVNSVRIYENNPTCYKAKFTHEYPGPWSRTVFFGGPGDCIL